MHALKITRPSHHPARCLMPERGGKSKCLRATSRQQRRKCKEILSLCNRILIRGSFQQSLHGLLEGLFCVFKTRRPVCCIHVDDRATDPAFVELTGQICCRRYRVYALATRPPPDGICLGIGVRVRETLGPSEDQPASCKSSAARAS